MVHLRLVHFKFPFPGFHALTRATVASNERRAQRKQIDGNSFPALVYLFVSWFSILLYYTIFHLVLSHLPSRRYRSRGLRELNQPLPSLSSLATVSYPAAPSEANPFAATERTGGIFR